MSELEQLQKENDQLLKEIIKKDKVIIQLINEINTMLKG